MAVVLTTAIKEVNFLFHVNPNDFVRAKRIVFLIAFDIVKYRALFFTRIVYKRVTFAFGIIMTFRVDVARKRFFQKLFFARAPKQCAIEKSCVHCIITKPCQIETSALAVFVDGHSYVAIVYADIAARARSIKYFCPVQSVLF